MSYAVYFIPEHEKRKIIEITNTVHDPYVFFAVFAPRPITDNNMPFAIAQHIQL